MIPCSGVKYLSVGETGEVNTHIRKSVLRIVGSVTLE